MDFFTAFAAMRLMKSRFNIITVLSFIIISVAATSGNAMNMACFDKLFQATQSVIAKFSRPTIEEIAAKIVTTAESSLRKTGWKPEVGNRGKEYWTIDGPISKTKANYPNRAYESAFVNIFFKTGSITKTSRDFIENYLKSRKADQKGTHILDLFGSGFYIQDQTLADSITGMRLGPFDREFLPKDYLGYIPTEILGDALNSKTWKELDMSKKTRSIPSFDLVTLNPEGGWKEATFNRTYSGNANALKYIVGQVLTRLSATGRFYFHIPLPYGSKDFSMHPVLRDLVIQIEKYTHYRLVLDYQVGIISPIAYLDGAIVPK